MNELEKWKMFRHFLNDEISAAAAGDDPLGIFIDWHLGKTLTHKMAGDWRWKEPQDGADMYLGFALSVLNGQFQKTAFFTTKELQNALESSEQKNCHCLLDMKKALTHTEAGKDDVIGCGVDLAKGQKIIYTLNGKLIETPDLRVDSATKLYPCVSMFKAGTKIEANFGTKEFLLPAHKLILVAASDIFGAMFRFDARNRDPSEENKPVEVPDVEVGAFKALLSFIYADDVSGLNGDNAIAVLYAAKNMIFLNLSIRTRFIGEEDFARRCLACIDQNADALILSEEFLQIDQKLLCEILARDELWISEEIAIWNAVNL
uniref:BTB domain-containing protein n=1 Tax=Globodera rostochiensis TaxID=31243 RepID=A0A914HC59_GLORO